MRCLSENFLHIYWDENYDIIYLEWHYYPGSEKYRESLELALNLARRKNIKYGIANVKQLVNLVPDDLTWLIDTWFPELPAAQWNCVQVDHYLAEGQQPAWDYSVCERA